MKLNDGSLRSSEKIIPVKFYQSIKNTNLKTNFQGKTYSKLKIHTSTLCSYRTKQDQKSFIQWHLQCLFFTIRKK